MANISEVPQYTKLMQSEAIKDLSQPEKCMVIALLTTVLEIGAYSRSNKEKSRVIKEGKAVLEKNPQLKDETEKVLGENWFDSVFSSVLTAE